ncbi:MAG: hypothetical protein ABI051_04295 [Vicinamibacterales bacterium]
MARRGVRAGKKGKARSGAEVIATVLKKAGSRPTIEDKQADKIKYAVRFAEWMATELASDLRPFFKDIAATTKREAGAAGGKKQLDVNFSTPSSGLALGISLKSVHLRDVGSGHKYGHNKKRNTEELLVEVTGYHRRQPYAVLVAILFLPDDSCTDGRKGKPSSFGSWVRHLRPHVGRVEPEDDIALFEKIYIALYDPQGTDLRFFDVESDPPKNAKPRANGPLFGEDLDDWRPLRSMSYGEFLEAMQAEYLKRNPVTFKWADGEEEILPLDEIDEQVQVDEDDEDS